MRSTCQPAAAALAIPLKLDANVDLRLLLNDVSIRKLSKLRSSRCRITA
jgi:hypothetical protein